MKKIIYLCLLAVLATLLLCCSKKTEEEKQEQTATVEEEDRGYIVKVGDVAPDFTMELTTGDTIKLSELQGKVVMLQFTASWCGVCAKKMPFIEKHIWQKHQNNPNFALFAVDRDEPLETVLKFIKATKITYPVGLDPNADIFGLFADKKSGVTRNVIIDKTGKIVMLTRLFDETEFFEMVELIDELVQ